MVLLRTSGIIVLYINHHDGTDQWLNQLQGSVFRVEGIDDDIELPQLETTEPLPASHDLTSRSACWQRSVTATSTTSRSSQAR